MIHLCTLLWQGNANGHTVTWRTYPRYVQVSQVSVRYVLGKWTKAVFKPLSVTFIFLPATCNRGSIVRQLAAARTACHGKPRGYFLSLSPQKVFLQLEVDNVQLAPVRMSLKKSTSTLPGRLTMGGELMRYCNITATMLCRLCGVIAGKAAAIPDTLQQQQQQQHFLSFCRLPCSFGQLKCTTLMVCYSHNAVICAVEVRGCV